MPEPANGLHIETDTNDDGTIVLRPSGELDAATAPTLDQAVEMVSGERVVMDLSGVSFLDSAGLRSLLLAHKQTNLTLRNPTEAVTQMFEIVGVTNYFNIEV